MKRIIANQDRQQAGDVIHHEFSHQTVRIAKITKHLKSAITAASLGWNERSTNPDTPRHDECNSKFNDVQSKHLWTQACDNVVSAVKRRRSVLAPKHLKLVSLFEVYKAYV